MQAILAIEPLGYELYHYGVKNQKWGYRRYQNMDKSLTPLGRIHYGVGEARKSIAKATKSAIDYSDRANDYLTKKYNDAKIDTLDTLNRKGILDFLDSKADAPFSAIRSSDTKEAKSFIDSLSDFKSSVADDPIEGLKKISRYSSMVTAMRKNNPYAKIEDTSKPWMESFGNKMMGWNHLGEIEQDVSTKAGAKFIDSIMSGGLKNTSYDEMIRSWSDPTKYRRPDLVGHKLGNGFAYTEKAYTESDHESVMKDALGRQLKRLATNVSWDKPMTIESVDGNKVNAVIYDNGGGAQGYYSPSTRAYWKKAADEVRDYIAKTGKLPTDTIDRTYRNVTNEAIGFDYYYDQALSKWINDEIYGK